MIPTNKNLRPDALMFLASACPHCPVVLEGLSILLKEGVIGQLEAVNVEVHPERAAELGVRTVPWVRIGPFELDGLQSHAELRRWAEQAHSPEGVANFFYKMLISGHRDQVEAMARQEPSRLKALVSLMERSDTSMAVRIGIGAVLEELQGSGLTETIIPDLGALARNGNALTRADACHFLSLIGSQQVVPWLQACLDDEDKEVREIAAEALEELEKKP